MIEILRWTTFESNFNGIRVRKNTKKKKKKRNLSEDNL